MDIGVLQLHEEQVFDLVNQKLIFLFVEGSALELGENFSFAVSGWAFRSRLLSIVRHTGSARVIRPGGLFPLGAPLHASFKLPI